MNKFKGITGGHPLQIDDFLWLQTAYSESLKASGRGLVPESVPSYVIEGCTVTKTGNNYTNTSGVIFLDGEFYIVDELTTAISDSGTPKWGVVETNGDTRNYGDGNPRNPYVYGKAQLYTSTHPNGLISIEEINHVKNYLNMPFEKKEFMGTATDLADYFNGGVGIDGTAWEGFYFMNGQTINGYTVPDLIGRTTVGFQDTTASDDVRFDNGYNTLLSSGGSKKHTLTELQAPSHYHKIIADTAGNSGYNGDPDSPMVGIGGGYNNDGNFAYRIDINTNQGVEASHGRSSTTGGDQPHENRMPFLVSYPVIRLPIRLILEA